MIDRVKFLTESALKEAKCLPVFPVKILLLEFQMPVKNGLQVVTELKEYYKQLKNEQELKDEKVQN